MLASFDYAGTRTSLGQPPALLVFVNALETLRWWNARLCRVYLVHPMLAQYVDRRKAVLAPMGCSSNPCPYEDHPFPHRYFDGTVYLNLSSNPFAFPKAEWDRILLELRALRPEVLESEPVCLSLPARAAKRRKVSVPSLRTRNPDLRQSQPVAQPVHRRSISRSSAGRPLRFDRGRIYFCENVPEAMERAIAAAVSQGRE